MGGRFLLHTIRHVCIHSAFLTLVKVSTDDRDAFGALKMRFGWLRATFVASSIVG